MSKSPGKGLHLMHVNVDYPTPLDDWIASTFPQATLKPRPTYLTTNIRHIDESHQPLRSRGEASA